MKVGLKETLSLLAAGYKKKDIEAMIAAEEEEKEQEAPATDTAKSEASAPVKDKKAPDDAAAKESNPEPDYKTMYEELLKKNQEAEDKLKKIQQDNIHKDSAPVADEAKKSEADALSNLVRSFM